MLMETRACSECCTLVYCFFTARPHVCASPEPLNITQKKSLNCCARYTASLTSESRPTNCLSFRLFQREPQLDLYVGFIQPVKVRTAERREYSKTLYNHDSDPFSARPTNVPEIAVQLSGPDN